MYINAVSNCAEIYPHSVNTQSSSFENKCEAKEAYDNLSSCDVHFSTYAVRDYVSPLLASPFLESQHL